MGTLMVVAMLQQVRLVTRDVRQEAMDAHFPKRGFLINELPINLFGCAPDAHQPTNERTERVAEHLLLYTDCAPWVDGMKGKSEVHQMGDEFGCPRKITKRLSTGGGERNKL